MLKKLKKSFATKSLAIKFVSVKNNINDLSKKLKGMLKQHNDGDSHGKPESVCEWILTVGQGILMLVVPFIMFRLLKTKNKTTNIFIYILYTIIGVSVAAYWGPRGCDDGDYAFRLV